MPSAENAILYYEGDQIEFSLQELTDQGDHKDFRGSSELWSGISGKAPVIRPNGISSGGVVIPAVSGSNNVVDISLCKCYLAGVETEIAAVTDETIARPTVSDYVKYSIQITAAGAISAVKGTEGSSFSTTRGAAGGPPYVLATSVELAQVWLDSKTAAAIKSSEIKQVKGSSLERYDYPLWETKYINEANNVLGHAGIEFLTALPTIHTGDVPKDVYASWYEPVFVEIVDAYGFKPPANAHSINTQAVYGRIKGSKNTTLNPGSFSAQLRDGITDNILKFTDKMLWFKFKPERLNDPYLLAQGYLGQQTDFPEDSSIAAAFTIAAESVGQRIGV